MKTFNITVIGDNEEAINKLYDTLSGDQPASSKVLRYANIKISDGETESQFNITFYPLLDSSNIPQKTMVTNADFAINVLHSAHRTLSNTAFFRIGNPKTLTYNLDIIVPRNKYIMTSSATPSTIHFWMDENKLTNESSVHQMLMSAAKQFFDRDRHPLDKFYIEAFRDAHSARKQNQWLSGFTTLFRRSQINNNSTLVDIIKDALHKKSSDANQVCIEKNWLTQNGELHDEAPESVKISYAIAKEEIEEANRAAQQPRQ